MPDIWLCGADEVKPDRPLQVALEGRDPFAVFKVGGEIFITDDFCTHGKASLSDEGDLDGFVITCGWHDGAFDIRTGDVKARPCTEPLKVYRAIVRDGDVYVALA